MNNKAVIAEHFKLPSNGLLYGNNVNPNVKLRSMTVRDEMKRLGPSNDGSMYRAMAEVLDDCLVEKPGISTYDMCLGDYQFLLHKLRIVTYGPEYMMECRCPVCTDVDEYLVNLENLTLLELTEFEESMLELELPHCGKKIKLNINTPRLLDNIEKDVVRTRKQHKKQSQAFSELDWHLRYQLVYSIDTIDGEKASYTFKESFCDNLVGRDFNAILNKQSEIDKKVGLGAIMELLCNNCGSEFSAPFRLTTEFYRPSRTS